MRFDSPIEESKSTPSLGDADDDGRPLPEPASTEVAAAKALGSAAPASPEASPSSNAQPSKSNTESKEAGSRLAVRWGSVGLCDAEEGSQLQQKRRALFASFVREDAEGADLLHDPDVRVEVLRTVREALGQGRDTASGLVHSDPQKPHPTTIVYKDLDQLRSVSCANRAAIGYFDGAIHLSGDWQHGLLQIRQTVVHEYVHYVLLSLGIETPMWFQEGLAMYAAQEDWWKDPSLGLVAWLRNSHLPFDVLVPAFPHTADESFAGAAYYQSFMMVEFVRQRRGVATFATLAHELSSRSVLPEDAFLHVLGLEFESSSSDSLERAWAQFLNEQVNYAYPVASAANGAKFRISGGRRRTHAVPPASSTN